jgi:uncharacterized membrane protein
MAFCEVERTVSIVVAGKEKSGLREVTMLLFKILLLILWKDKN